MLDIISRSTISKRTIRVASGFCAITVRANAETVCRAAALVGSRSRLTHLGWFVLPVIVSCLMDIGSLVCAAISSEPGGLIIQSNRKASQAGWEYVNKNVFENNAPSCLKKANVVWVDHEAIFKYTLGQPSEARTFRLRGIETTGVMSLFSAPTRKAFLVVKTKSGNQSVGSDELDLQLIRISDGRFLETHTVKGQKVVLFDKLKQRVLVQTDLDEVKGATYTLMRIADSSALWSCVVPGVKYDDDVRAQSIPENHAFVLSWGSLMPVDVYRGRPKDSFSRRDCSFGSLCVDADTGETTGAASLRKNDFVAQVWNKKVIKLDLPQGEWNTIQEFEWNTTLRLVSLDDPVSSVGITLPRRAKKADCPDFDELTLSDLALGMEGAIECDGMLFSVIKWHRALRFPVHYGKNCSGPGVGLINWSALEWVPLVTFVGSNYHPRSVLVIPDNRIGN